MTKKGTIARVAILAGGLLVATSPAPMPALGQERSLDRVEELARLGRPEEARELLMAWWDHESDDAPRRDLQRGLWLRARLTVDPVQAELDYRRLVVLYPRGTYTPDALMRLAQAAFETGDPAAARGYVRTLSSDFPGSPVTREAETWLRDAGAAPAPPDAEARTNRAGGDGPGARRGDDPPRPSDASNAAEPPVTTAPSRAEPSPAGAPSRTEERASAAAAAKGEPAGNYFVQLGAFAEEERARALYDEVRSAGIEVRIVRVDGSRFLHVRHGRYVDREDAVAELERLAESGVNAALVRDERTEELVRGR